MSTRPLSPEIDLALLHLPQRWHDRLPGGRMRRWDRIVHHAAAFPPAHRAVDSWAGGRIARFADLQLVTAMIAALDDHALYDHCLRQFDPDLPLNPCPRAFMAHGVGPGSLNRFRWLDMPGGARFEKIYDMQGICYRRMRFAYDTVLPRVLDGQTDAPLRAPRLIRARCGRRLAAVEFECVATHDAPVQDLPMVLSIANTLGAIPAKPFKPLPRALRTPRQALLWPRGRLLALLETEAPALLDTGGKGGLQAALDAWDLQLHRLPAVFTHGDLNTVNLAPDAVVLDWDRAGFLPWGAELAYAVLFHGPFETSAALLAFCERHVERPGRAAQDRFAFLMYLLHFLPERFAPGPHAALYADVLHSLHAAATRLEAA